MKTSKTKRIAADGVVFTLIRSDRITVGIQVKLDGEVVVRAPFMLPEAEIRAIIASKVGWIEKNKAKMAERESEQRDKSAEPPFTCADGQTLPYLGETLTVTHRDDAREPYADGGFLVLPLGMGTDGLIYWLRNRAADELNPRLHRYSELLGVKYKSVRLSDARTRWGMCSGKNSINLSWRLIFCPPEAIDFVVAHELCHVKHKNHGAAFHAELENLIHGCKQTDKWLKENSKLILLL